MLAHRACAYVVVVSHRYAGEGDRLEAERALAGRLPESLAPLARLAYNYLWSWLAGGEELFASIDPESWPRCGANPVRLLQECPAAALGHAGNRQRSSARSSVSITHCRSTPAVWGCWPATS